jgi:tRNA(fMet)-specific endonuclease VapC
VTYLLDTNIVSYFIRGDQAVVGRMRATKPSDVAVSAITVFELRYGAAKRGSAKLSAAIDGFLDAVSVLPFDEDAAAHSGTLKATMEAQGTPVPAPDLLIAAHALAVHRILVTNNTRDFSRIPNLTLEDWSNGSIT